MLQRFVLYLVTLLMLIIAPLTVAQAADPVTTNVIMPPAVSLDPVSLGRTDSSGRTIAENLFVGLTRYNPVTGQIERGLALDWTVSDDKLIWTFKLRNDVKWVRYNAGSGAVEAVRPVVAGDFVDGTRGPCGPTPPKPAGHTIYVTGGCPEVSPPNPTSVNEAFISTQQS